MICQIIIDKFVMISQVFFLFFILFCLPFLEMANGRSFAPPVCFGIRVGQNPDSSKNFIMGIEFFDLAAAF